MYVLVDYHSHDAEKHPEQAIKFFETVARKYGQAPNLIYEIYNEPLDTDWSTADQALRRESSSRASAPSTRTT